MPGFRYPATIRRKAAAAQQSRHTGVTNAPAGEVWRGRVDVQDAGAVQEADPVGQERLDADAVVFFKEPLRLIDVGVQLEDVVETVYEGERVKGVVVRLSRIDASVLLRWVGPATSGA